MKKSIKTKLLFLITAFSILITGSILGVHYFWDTEHQTIFFEKKIETLLQRPAHIHKACLRLFPRVQVILEGVMVEGNVGKSDFMFLEKLRLGIAFKSLFTGTVHCNVLSLDQPRITVVRNQDRRFDVGDFLKSIARSSLVEEQTASWFKKFQFRLGKVIIRDGELTIIDNWTGDAPVTFRFFDLDLQAGKIASSGLTPVMFNCRFSEDLRKSALITLQGEIGPLLDSPNLAAIRFKGDMGITDLDISSLAPYVRGAAEIGAAEGFVSGTASFAGSLKGKLAVAVKLDIVNLSIEQQELFEKGLRVAKIGLSFSLTRNNKGIGLSDIHLALPEFGADGKLLITNDEPPLIKAEVKIGQCKYRHLLPYLPLSLFSKAVKEAMTEHSITGTIDTLLLSYSGTGSQTPPKPPKGSLDIIEGNLSFHDFSIKFLDDISLATHLNGELSLKNRDLTLTNLTGRFGNSEIQEGTISLSKLSFLDASLGLNLDLYEVLKLLHDNRIPESLGHSLRRLKYMDGTAILKFDASGPLDDLQALAFGGEMELLGANIDYQHFRKPGRDLTGTIHFTPYVIRSDNLKGWWANSPADAWFQIENYLSPPKALLTAHVESEEAEINDLASAFFPWEGVYGEGLVDIHMDFSCPGYRLQDFFFEGTGTFADLTLTFPAFPHSFTHLGGRVDFSSEGLRFSDISAKTGSSAFSFVGRWDSLRNPVISGEVHGTTADLLDFYARPSVEEKQRLMQYTVDNVSVTIEEVRCKDLFFNDLKSTVSFDDGKVTLTSLTAANGKFREFDFVNLTNVRENEPDEIGYQNRVASIPYVALESQSGIWVGTDIKVPMWSEHEETFSLTTTIENISTEEFLQCFAPDKQRLTGTLNLTGSISGVGKSLSDSIKTWEGAVALTVEDGVLKKHSIVAKILSLLNVVRLFKQDYSNLLDKGMHYNTIEGAFHVEQGIARTDNFFFDSPSVKMDAVGEIDLKEKAYDMEIGVAPLETVDKVVEKIPLLGTVLMGDEGAVIVTYYKLTGSFDDPALKQVVFTSLGRKAQGIFQRIFQLPMTILKRDKKSPHETNESDKEGGEK